LIHSATLDDLELLVPLFDAYRQFYKQESDPSAARAYLKARLERGEARIFLESEGLGFALCYSTFSSVALKPLVILNDLYTIPQARGRGVGTALLEQCRIFAAESGAAILRLRTAHDNHTAQSVYERFGFAKDGVFWTYDLRV
jgi:ribosomal protein S18 acetylase RimI-like enzyme